MMNTTQWHEYDCPKQLVDELASRVGHCLVNAAKSRGHAYLVVSGGSTPVHLFDTLSQMPLPWEQIIITLADDRCLPAEHADSNAFLVHQHLLKDYAKAAHFIPLYTPDEPISEIQARLGNVPTFDVVILGLGEDGHTASLFPCSAQITYALSDEAPSVVATTPQTAPYERVTLSRRRLLNSHYHFLHLLGARKKQVCQRAMQENNMLHMPISAFLHNTDIALQIYYAP